MPSDLQSVWNSQPCNIYWNNSQFRRNEKPSVFKLKKHRRDILEYLPRCPVMFSQRPLDYSKLHPTSSDNARNTRLRSFHWKWEWCILHPTVQYESSDFDFWWKIFVPLQSTWTRIITKFQFLCSFTSLHSTNMCSVQCYFLKMPSTEHLM